MLASKYGQLEVVKLLLDRGALVKAKNNNGMTCLMLASQYKQYEVVNFFSSRKRIKNKNCDIWYSSFYPITFSFKETVFPRME